MVIKATVFEAQKLIIFACFQWQFLNVFFKYTGKGFYNELVNFMISGEIYALKLVSLNGIKKWRDLMCPTNFETGKKTSPNSIRALYGSSMTKNASHGSDSIESAQRELEFYFATKNNEFYYQQIDYYRKYDKQLRRYIWNWYCMVFFVLALF